MATRTAVQSGNWTDPNTWDTGVPVDGDAFVIPGGITVTYDEDMSTWATGMVSGEVNGVLQASEVPGDYYLKMAGHITGSGEIRAGSSTAEYPLTCSFTIAEVGYICGPKCLLYPTTPEYPFVTTTAEVSAGGTTLYVDTDLTADIWSVGDEVVIFGENPASDYNFRQEFATITAVHEDRLEVAPLAYAHRAGAWVGLLTRNVRILHNSYGIRTSRNILHKVGAQFICNGSYPAFYDNKWQPSEFWGTVKGRLCQVSTVPLMVRNAVVAGSGLPPIATLYNELVATDSLLIGDIAANAGTFVRCKLGVRFYNGHITMLDSCDVRGYFDLPGIVEASESRFRYSQAFFNTPGTLRRCLIDATTEASYNGFLPHFYLESFDHDQVPGAYKAWTRGGVVVWGSSPAPAGYGGSYNLVPESADHLCFYQTGEVLVPAGGYVRAKIYLRKDSSMSYLPRVQIVDIFADPLVDDSNEPLAEAVMTDSVDEWEAFSITWENTGTTARQVKVRVLAKAASGNVYATVDVWTGPQVGALSELTGTVTVVDELTGTVTVS